MSNLARAIALAAEAHVEQLDKSGAPYILHPIRMMLRMMREEGFSEEVIAALDGVAARPEETYEEFVARAKTNPVARKVKIADLEDNMDLKRLGENLSDHAVDRLIRYHKARQYLHN